MKTTSRHYLPNREFSFQEITYTRLQFSVSYLTLAEKKVACGMEGFIITAYTSQIIIAMVFAFMFLNCFALEIQWKTREMCGKNPCPCSTACQMAATGHQPFRMNTRTMCRRLSSAALIFGRCLKKGTAWLGTRSLSCLWYGIKDGILTVSKFCATQKNSWQLDRHQQGSFTKITAL